jgi:hypothetical protein
LPTTGAAPDILGISLVSGFYGPGSWTGWYLTLLASYVRLFTSDPDSVDPNTVLFMLGTNWAAVDFFRRTSGLIDAGGFQEAGMIAASLTVVHRGNAHAMH